jgi:hypothetical protein
VSRIAIGRAGRERFTHEYTDHAMRERFFRELERVFKGVKD